MARIYSLSVLSLICLTLFSCQKESKKAVVPPSSEQLIVGKWVLQTEHSVQYVDGVKKLDTVYNASANSYVVMQFKSNDTVTTAGVYASGDPGNLNAGISVENFSGESVYKFVNNVFSMTGPVSGFGNGAVYGFRTTTGVPVISAVSNVVQINELTTTNLALHSEYVYTYTLNATTQTFKLVNDLSYTK
ncbi:MAG: hypothetical protein ACHQHN_16795 [Sphingobacteriales bacterium]